MALPTAGTPGYTSYPGVVYGPDVACEHLARWLYWFRKLCVAKGLGDPSVWQLTGGNTASGGTHSQGGAYDLGGINYNRTMLAREAGSVDWGRNWTGNVHSHGVLDCVHNDPARYQRTACIVYRKNGLGYLGLAGPDPYPAPSKWRTYLEGIDWMKSELSRINGTSTEEWDVATSDYISDQIKAVASMVAYVQQQNKTIAGMVAAEDAETDEQFNKLYAAVMGVDEEVWNTKVRRGDNYVPVIQEVADSKTMLLRVESVLSDLGSKVDAANAALAANDLDGVKAALEALRVTVEQAHPKAEPQPVEPALGIDVSGFQSDTLINEWLPKSEFVFVKATEGQGYDAPAYAHQIELIRAAAKKAGAYHLAWPENGWQADFDHYRRVAGLRVGEATVLDFEPWPAKQPKADPKTFPAYIVGWADAHLAQYGADPLFYVPDFFIPGIKANATPEQWERISSLPYFKPGKAGAYVSDPSVGPGETFGFKSLAAWQWTDKPLDQDILYVPWSTIAVKKV